MAMKKKNKKEVDALTLSLYNLTKSLHEIQSCTIGLYRPYADPSGPFMPVIGKDDFGNIECISVGSLLGLSTLYTSAAVGKLILFPKDTKGNDRTLADLMVDPIAFNKWYLENVK